MAAPSKRTRLKSLSQGRPPLAHAGKSNSRTATRNLIRKHHTLQKEQARALRDGNVSQAATIARQLEQQGGLERYQQASLLGQSQDRGGDSSRILMDWLKPVLPLLHECAEAGHPVRLLEVGALSTENACSRARVFDLTRIDLHSQNPEIVQQDFMQRPRPLEEQDRFHLISLSLVLNYVPEAATRGEMLRRTLAFLTDDGLPPDKLLLTTFPSLFLVLPVACVRNSRYLDEAHLVCIMDSLGYSLGKEKVSNKLIYQLWTRKPASTRTPIPGQRFGKKELRSGSTRNNFALVLE